MRPTVFKREQQGIAASNRAMQQNGEAKETMKRGTFRAQAMVEFALALPVFLLVIYGLIEGGRLIFTYATVATASREAVRYASATGLISSTGTIMNYQDCAGIRNTARRVGFTLNLQDNQIHIYYDRPNGTPPVLTPTEYCNPGFTSSNIVLNTGDRVYVNVTTQWTLLVPILPFNSRAISSGNTARTFMGMIDLAPTPTP